MEKQILEFLRAGLVRIGPGVKEIIIQPESSGEQSLPPLRLIFQDTIHFHPEIPPKLQEFLFTILETYRALGQKEYLRRAKLEKDVRPPIPLGRDQELLRRVLELRGAKIPTELIQTVKVEFSDPPSSVHKILKKLKESRRIRSHVKLERDSLALREQKPKPVRVRKEEHSWERVIGQLVKEGYLPRPISHQALKKLLSKKFPWVDWSKL